MKYTRFLSALFALAFMAAACGGTSITGVDDCDMPEPEQCRTGMIGSGG